MRPTVARHAAFTLVEVAFAVALLSVGLLAVAAMLVQASHTVHRAREMQASVATVSEVADSLSLFGSSGDGSRAERWGTIAWTETSLGGLAEVRFEARPAAPGRPPILEIVATVPLNE